MRVQQSLRKEAGATLAETMISTSIVGILFAVLLVGLVTLQRSFLASSHYASSQAAQLRVLDYLALDLRRALSVTRRADQGIDVRIPDYYVSGNASVLTPRDPRLQNGTVVYGAANVVVSYYQRGNGVYRFTNGVETELANDVEKFELVLPANLNQTVLTISANFVPRYSFGHGAAAKLSTSLTTNVLMRNIKSANL